MAGRPRYARSVDHAPRAHDLLPALRHGGVTTLDGLRSRLGDPDRELLGWALDDAVERGWVARNAPPDCGPDGLCGSQPPTTVTITAAGREALARSA